MVMTDESTLDPVTVGVVGRVLADLLKRNGRQIEPANIRFRDSLVDDLRIDSLMFVDLTVLLEQELGVAEFPMQRWMDSETLGRDPRYTVESLVRECMRVAPPSTGYGASQ